MKARRLIISLLILFSLVFTISACEDDTGGQVENGSDDTIATTIDSELEESSSNLGKRSNPVPIGQWIEFEDTYYESLESFDAIDGKFKLRITGVERGEEATEQLIKENQFNQAAPEGHEWVIASLEIEMLEGDEDAPYTVVPFISIVSSSGNEISQDDWATLDGNEFGHVDLFPGGSHSGRITKYIPDGDDSLMVYEFMLDSSIYFSISD